MFCCGFTPHPDWINDLSGRHVKGLWKLMWFWVRAEWGVSETCHSLSYPPHCLFLFHCCETVRNESHWNSSSKCKWPMLSVSGSTFISSAQIAGTCLCVCVCVFICQVSWCLAMKSWTGTNWNGLFGVTQDRIKSWYKFFFNFLYTQVFNMLMIVLMRRMAFSIAHFSSE